MSGGVFETAFWHQRFTEQARWTRQVRNYLFELAGIGAAARILEVGCGTGAVLSDLPGLTPDNLPARTKSTPYAVPTGYSTIHGLDISLESLRMAAANAPHSALCCGDAFALPYAAGSFDIVCCHYTLLWLADPAAAAKEMHRVTRPGGWVLCLAEPDYGGRIDYPAELSPIGEWQRQALRTQGADPLTGRKLGALLMETGLREVRSGVLGGQWQQSTMDEGELEWQVLEKDLGTLDDPPTAEVVSALRITDLHARRSGERLLYVPTFYAAGRV